jgi:hypothetical protein
MQQRICVRLSSHMNTSFNNKCGSKFVCDILIAEVRHAVTIPKGPRQQTHDM